MRIFIDSDVMLDSLLLRDSFHEASDAVLRWAEAHPGKAAISWHSVSNIAYLCKGDIRSALREFLVFMEIPSTGTMDLLHALMLNMPDLEDAMQSAAAEAFEAQVIVTRNTKHYKNAPVKALSPAELLPLLV